ncbi:hypothetical protein SEA_ASHTON_27 [Microbacterium phage Ashton]|uniref:Lipoprotein n=1 Tax=Microbacterium phage Ashton TaxID=2562366 RepID=A0A6M3T0H7_9CAUD|nr:hypothetical protein SEA_ASHTON_27 [Microbacterium phage Ashton]
MRNKLLALVAIGLLTLTGCGSSISTGTITGKTHSPAYVVSTTICTPVGKTTVCTPSTQYYPESWHFSLVNGDEEGYVYVDVDTYDNYDVGDWYPHAD